MKASELIYLNDAAKALKQKNFIIKNNTIVGADNTAFLIYTTLDPCYFYPQEFICNMQINSRELSAFVKDIQLMQDFKFHSNMNGLEIYNGSKILNFINKQQTFDNIAIDTNIKFVKTIQSNSDICNMCIEPEENVTEELSFLFALKKDSGCSNYVYKNKYYMTLFSGILPLNKSDKIYLSIYSNNSVSFNALFRVEKKKFNVIVCIAYLYI